MSAVAPSELVRLWMQEQLPTERAVGQILQQMVDMQRAIDWQAKTIRELREQIVDLSAKVPTNIATPIKKQGKTKG